MFLFGPPDIKKLKEKNDTAGLTKALKYKDPEIRKKAAFALGEVRAVESASALLDALTGGANHDIDTAVLSALSRIASGVDNPTLRARIAAAATAQLEHPDAGYFKEYAIQILTRLAGGAGVDGLLKALAFETVDRIRVIAALAQIGDARCNEALTAFLQTPSPERILAAELLLEKEPTGALAAIVLAEALNLADASSANKALSVLTRVGGKADRYLAAAGKPVEDALLAALGKGDVEILKLAVQLLGRIRSARAVEPVMAFLDHKKLELRVAAIAALGDIGDARAAGRLGAILTESNRQVLSAAALAMEKNGWSPTGGATQLNFSIQQENWSKVLEDVGPEVQDVLAVLGRVKNAEGRAAILQLLYEKGDPRYVDVAVLGLKDSSVKVRQQSAVLLESAGEIRTLAALIDGLKDESEKVCVACLRAIGALADASAVAAVARLAGVTTHWAVRSEACLALSRLGPPGLAVLVEFLKGDHSSLRDCARDALKQSGPDALQGEQAAWLALADENVDRVLQTGLHAQEVCIRAMAAPHLRLTAARALARLATPQAVEALCAGVGSAGTDHSANWSFAVECARLLGDLADPIAAEPMRSVLMKLWERNISMPDRKLEFNIVQALGKMDDPRAVSGLEAIYQHSQWSREGVIAALSQHKNPAAVDLLLKIAQTQTPERLDAIRALGIIGDPRARQPLADLLDPSGSEVSVLAAGALAGMQDPRSFEVLLHVVKHESDLQQGRWATQKLIEMYRAGLLSDAQKRELLSTREIITAPHTDTHYDLQTPQNCSSAFDHDDHTDRGLAMDFPL